MKQLAEGAESPLKEWFFAYTQDSPWMDGAGFEAWANQSGYPTAVTTWLSKQMSKITAEVCCMGPDLLLACAVGVNLGSMTNSYPMQENRSVKGHTNDISFSQFTRLLRFRIPDVQKSAGLQVSMLECAWLIHNMHFTSS